MDRETVVNNALDAIGHPRRIASLWDGSPEAIIARDLFDQARDEVLALQPWPFAVARYNLLLASNPHRPWTYRYELPVDAITVLDVMPTTFVISPDMEIQQWYWQEDGAGDNRTIHTMFESADAVVIRRFADPDQWPPDFTMLVVQNLAKKFAALLRQNEQSGEHSAS